MTGNITSGMAWHASEITSEERQKLLRQKPVTLCLRGLRAAGKSTLACSLERALIQRGHACIVLDGDNVRHTLTRDLGFSNEDRAENFRRIAEVARLMNNAGVVVITALILPSRYVRANARAIIGQTVFREIYISSPLAACETRDPKGLYRHLRTL
jgi:adenylyl-sulfate kinase